MSDEQRVRTLAGQVGVEISRSRVRTPGKAGYGLYRVRGSIAHRTRAEMAGLVAQAITGDRAAERAPWTPYLFTLAMIRICVEDAIRAGTPDRPGPLLLRADGHGWSDPVDATVPTRWTSAYRGRRDLGTFTATVVPHREETEPDGEPCTGTLRFADGDVQARCDGCGGWVGRWANLPGLGHPSRPLPLVGDASRPGAAEGRRKAANAEFHKAHLLRRVHGNKARQVMKRRMLRDGLGRHTAP